MKLLVKAAFAIDWLNEKLCWFAAACVISACLVSAANAFRRYGLDVSSNAWLEIQWYLFAATVMLGASYVLRMNEHVRVDLLYNKLPGNGRVYLDLFGLIVFLLPVVCSLAYLSWPIFMRAWTTGEVSSNAGGLIRWPVLLLMPAGFALLALQGLSEIVKRVAYLTGSYAMDTHYERPLQ
jgi:TRAP-type mannitol/chloroaromatic compound transport system permease small subunit